MHTKGERMGKDAPKVGGCGPIPRGRDAGRGSVLVRKVICIGSAFELSPRRCQISHSVYGNHVVFWLAIHMS